MDWMKHKEEGMGKSKVNMPNDIKVKCHAAIHSATVAAGAAGVLPIPFSDTIPITAAQIGMIMALGKVFGVTLSDGVAKSIAGVVLAQGVGRTLFTNALKLIPGAGSLAGAVIASTVTEGLGWLVADDFFRMSQGQEPKDIVDTMGQLRGAFSGGRWH